MRITRTDQASLSTALDHLLSGIVNNSALDRANKQLSQLDSNDEDSMVLFAQIEEYLRSEIAKNPGFLRHSHVTELLGFKGASTLSSYWKSGKQPRKLKDNSLIRWSERPSDNYTYFNENKDYKSIGWELNDYISNVLPWLKARQSDRILSPSDKERFNPTPISLVVKSPKGGSEKTTETVHLAVTAALLGARVLVIDGDPQTTASTLLGYPLAQYPIQSDFSLHSALDNLHYCRKNDEEDDFDPSTYTRKTIFENVDIITGSTHGSLIDYLVDDDPELIDCLIQALKATGNWDFIFVDTRPQSVFQDLAQYAAADVIINALQSTTTGLASTRQGLQNYIGHFINRYPDIQTRKNQICVTVPTCVQSEVWHPSREIFNELTDLSLDRNNPLNIATSHIQRSKALSDATNQLETFFQQSNVAVKAGSTKTCLSDYIIQFSFIFENAVMYHWLKLNGKPVDEALIYRYIENNNEESEQLIDDPLMVTDAPYCYLDVGMGFAIEKVGEPASISKSSSNANAYRLNPKRFLRAKDLALDEGHQIIMLDGKFYALSYNLDELKPLTPFVHRANGQDGKPQK